MVDTIFGRWQEHSRLNITNVLRRDNHQAVKIGELVKNTEAIKVVRPKFNKVVFPRTRSSEKVRMN